MGEENLTAILGLEEVVFLLRCLHARTLPGMGEEPLGALTEAERDAALLAAQHSLQARQFIRLDIEKKRVDLDPFIVGIFRVCILPEVSVMLSHFKGEAGIVKHIHLAKGAIVERNSPQEGVFVFRLSNDIGEVCAHLDTLIGLDGQGASRVGSLTLPVAALDELKEKATGEEADIRTWLQQNGASGESAEAFARAVSRQSASGSLAGIRYSYPEKGEPVYTVQGFSFLEGETRFWEMTPSSQDQTTIHIQPISAENFKEKIRKLF